MSLLPALLLATLAAQEPPSPEALLQTALTQVLTGHLADAEGSARQALATMGPNSDRVAAYQILGAVLANTGRTREAWDQIAKGFALRPQGTRLGGLKHTMALISWTTGDLTAAARWMAESLALLQGSDEFWEVMVDQAGLEMARGKKSRAAELCREALPRIIAIRGPKHPVIVPKVYACAVIQLERQPETAERQLMELLQDASHQTDGGRAILMAQIARARLQLKRREDAAAAIDHAVALARGSGDPQMLAPFLTIRARILRAQKRKEEAAACDLEAASLSAAKSNTVVDARMLRAAASQ